MSVTEEDLDREYNIGLEHGRCWGQWKDVKDRKPPPHSPYLVRRDYKYFVAKPCYGLHNPWWVPQTPEGELEPTEMNHGDVWREIDE